MHETCKCNFVQNNVKIKKCHIKNKLQLNVNSVTTILMEIIIKMQNKT